MTKVLVTGGTGFIGSAIVDRLLGDGHEVVRLDRPSSGRRPPSRPRLQVAAADLTRPESYGVIPEGPYAAVFHLAGQTSVARSFDDPVADFDANARATLLLSRWSLQAKVPAFVFASSVAVYGNPESTPIPETAPCRPISYYGASKRASELAAALAANEGQRVVAFRMFNVYGPGQDLNDLKRGIVGIFLSHLVRGAPLTIRGRMDRVRDFVYVDDVVDAWMKSLHHGSGTYNLGSGAPTTFQQLFDGLRTELGLSASYPLRLEAPTPGDPLKVVADTTAIRRDLGWDPTVPLAAGLARTAQWARANPPRPA